MSQDITLEEAIDRAHQAEVICRMLATCADTVDVADVEVVARLVGKLTGNVAGWLIEESESRRGSK